MFVCVCVFVESFHRETKKNTRKNRSPWPSLVEARSIIHIAKRAPTRNKQRCFQAINAFKSKPWTSSSVGASQGPFSSCEALWKASALFIVSTSRSVT